MGFSRVYKIQVLLWIIRQPDFLSHSKYKQNKTNPKNKTKLLLRSPHGLVSSPPFSLLPWPDPVYTSSSYSGAALGSHPSHHHLPHLWLQDLRDHCLLPSDPERQIAQMGCSRRWPPWPRPFYLYLGSRLPCREGCPVALAAAGGSGLGGAPPAVPEQVRVEQGCPGEQARREQVAAGQVAGGVDGAAAARQGPVQEEVRGAVL